MLGDERNWLIGLTRLGSPVFNISGGAPEDGDEGADEGDAEEETGEEGEEEAEDDYTPPTKDEFVRIQAALKKANREAANRRHLLDKHGIDPRTGQRYDEDEEGEDDTPSPKTSKRKKQADEEEEDQPDEKESPAHTKLRKDFRIAQKRSAQREALLTSALSKKAAAAALAEAGWNGQGAGIIERMIDIGDVELDDEGEIIGLDEQVAEVKQSMPGWFKATRNTTRRVKAANGAADVDGGDKVTKPPAAEPVGWLQRLENQIQGIEE